MKVVLEKSLKMFIFVLKILLHNWTSHKCYGEVLNATTGVSVTICVVILERSLKSPSKVLEFQSLGRGGTLQIEPFVILLIGSLRSLFKQCLYALLHCCCISFV